MENASSRKQSAHLYKGTLFRCFLFFSARVVRGQGHPLGWHPIYAHKLPPAKHFRSQHFSGRVACRAEGCDPVPLPWESPAALSDFSSIPIQIKSTEKGGAGSGPLCFGARGPGSQRGLGRVRIDPLPLAAFLSETRVFVFPRCKAIPSPQPG